MSIEVKNLSFTYGKKTPFEKIALDNVSFNIPEGQTVGIIGSTGSGKSTLMQHLNGLLRATSGKICIYDMDLTVKRPDFKKLRKTVGMLFQYPEYQLFSETVLKDVTFGPRNFGFTQEEALVAAEESIKLVGLNFDEVKNKSPFELSGGQKRRVAIAGVIAYKPKILVLDEPTAGLDPVGKREMLELVRSLKTKDVKTVLMISHNMEEIAEFTERVLVLNEGRLVRDCPTRDLFSDDESFIGTGLKPPHTVHIASLLAKKGLILENIPLSVEELTKLTIRLLRG
jgi:energy-coupling factor transport system ATP-binding protein